MLGYFKNMADYEGSKNLYIALGAALKEAQMTDRGVMDSLGEIFKSISEMNPWVLAQLLAIFAEIGS